MYFAMGFRLRHDKLIVFQQSLPICFAYLPPQHKSHILASVSHKYTIFEK